MAGHVHDAPGIGLVDMPNDLIGTAPGRVQQQPVTTLAYPALIAVDGGQIGAAKRGVIDVVPLCVLTGALDLPLFASFVLMENQDGLDTLRRYYRRYIEIAMRADSGFILEAPTWRACAGSPR